MLQAEATQRKADKQEEGAAEGRGSGGIRVEQEGL